MIALVDADNFYVSVERIFKASLHHKPFVVLSSNDANVIARSPEAKALGITMGMPAFQLKEHGVIQISSNFSLYGDMSNRMMKVLALFTPVVEYYSIDEAFVDLGHVPAERVQEYGEQIRATVLHYTGIHVSIGIAPTKVLAKIATEIVKKHPEQKGVLSLTTMSRDEVDNLLSKVSIEDVWGIGRKSVAKLQVQGKIFTAKQLRDVDLMWIRRVLKVVGVRIVLELRGISCLPLETHPKPKQGIMASQSFGRPVESLQELEEAVATYASIAAMKLRSQQSQALQVHVFLHTNFFNSRQPQYANSASQTLAFPTAFTPDLIAAALSCIRHIYKTGYQFKKAGVYLTHITPQDVLQADLFGAFSFDEHERKRRLMESIDEINRLWGRNTIFYGAIGLKREWQMKQTRKSPHYTTRWNELLTIHASQLETTDEKQKNGLLLMELHLNYEEAKEYQLTWIENKDVSINWRVERMKLKQTKDTVIVNEWLTLAEIPQECFQYKLGNRSALEWVIDQYQMSTDARSGIMSDPNREDDEQYIVRLVGKVVTVSVETVHLVHELEQTVKMEDWMSEIAI